jgi:hypothetical protein
MVQHRVRLGGWLLIRRGYASRNGGRFASGALLCVVQGSAWYADSRCSPRFAGWYEEIYETNYPVRRYIRRCRMKIEIFEITSKEDAVYLELLDKYKSNAELQELLGITIFPSEMILMGDLRLITVLDDVIDMDRIIKVYLVKDVDTDTFVWVIGKFIDDGKISMYPLLKKQSKSLQLAIRSALIEKGLL